MRLKVCGMTNIDQIKKLNQWNVEFAGLIFYPKSPRYVGKFAIQPADFKKEKLSINTIGVFVNASIDEVLTTAEKWKLSMVQLHGDETPKYCEQISNHINTIKAFRISDGDNLEWKIFPYHAVVDMFLFDTAPKPTLKGVKQTTYGGTGEHFDWNLLDNIRLNKPFFLSGGLQLTDAPEILTYAETHKNLFSTDINSRFEITPGVKDLPLVKLFKDALHK
jgi:phosphoribosylanthranilate isomerase